MRIVAGAWRGRPLVAPDGLATRPTADRVRETLFSMLVSRLGSFDGVRVADLFAGSGALGFEALSRGAAHVTFVERDAKAIVAIRANAANLGCADRIAVMTSSALTLPPSAPFDLVLADPPYQPGSGTAAIAAIGSAAWVAPGGWLSVETNRGESSDPAGFTIEAERDVGRARLTIMRLS
jgi:16S rRNA (guanine966-N2)-methyltransferase